MLADAPIFTSFRDPAGRLCFLDGRILRVVNSSGVPDLTAFLSSPAARRLLADGAVVGTRVLSNADVQRLFCDQPRIRDLVEDAANSLVVEHDRIPFPSFPYEWPPEMLHQAAVLTLGLARELLADGMGLKDATPYNILFHGPNPVFIDLLSFQRRDPRDPSWVAFAQFIRTFLLPLLANCHYAMPLDQLLIMRRDGIEPEELYRWTSALRKLMPSFISLVSIPVWLGKRHNQDDNRIYQTRRSDDPEKARFILSSILKSLHTKLNKLAPALDKKSVWSDYMASNNNYSAVHIEAKRAFVEAAMRDFQPRRVLDVGCNTGFFSAVAARSGASVVAIDYDPVVVGRTWRRAREESLDILPLVVNLARPTPAVGWHNRECASFLDRARGSFDIVLMLAVLHHILVTERVPLSEVVDLAAELTTDWLLVEFIAPQDSMFQRLTRGRDELHKDLDKAAFEKAFGSRFEVARVSHQEGTFRWLYLLRKRPTCS